MANKQKYFDKTIGVRIGKDILRYIEILQESRPDRYRGISQVVRIAVIKLFREEENEYPRFEDK